VEKEKIQKKEALKQRRGKKGRFRSRNEVCVKKRTLGDALGKRIHFITKQSRKPDNLKKKPGEGEGTVPWGTAFLKRGVLGEGNKGGLGGKQVAYSIVEEGKVRSTGRGKKKMEGKKKIILTTKPA